MVDTIENVRLYFIAASKSLAEYIHKVTMTVSPRPEQAPYHDRFKL